MIDLWKQIEKKQFSPIYLLYGIESYLINETKQKLVNNVLTDEEMDFNLANYDLEETSIEVALEDAETFPFMGEKRLIFLHNAFFLTAEKGKQRVEHNIQKLEEYIQNPPSYTVLVIIAPYEKLDERKKITKQLKKQAALLEAKKLNEMDLKKWVFQKVAENGVQIDDNAVDLLITLAGTNLMMLSAEIDKLSLFVGVSNAISSETVENLTSRSLEQNIFSLVDKVVHRKINEALRIYYDLLKQNEEPIKILSILANQFRLLYQTKELQRRGYGQQQMASYLKVHPFRIKLAAGQAKLFSEEELKRIMLLCADSDYQMKTSGMNKVMIIEMLLFKLSKSA
ncbi:DNA polymerase III subunit delta [Heyndrickxia sporothermodurans]|uniref:DNA polymerase III subunit delta n=1 Tax=Heyndrickxia TaxID=2837504 RepID=UPI002DBED7AB|nr:DNA polymerase III subunit delta [Heyndrickxia sporothermodurans]MEB6548032.1 DNA polymerase III subunit delta [Heyndrickxia sporothermodurans]MED3781378.1 DNA polymerase III subunit delta [Heyndrickxia sporothermodurans]